MAAMPGSIDVDVGTTAVEAALDRLATCLEEAAEALRQGIGVRMPTTKQGLLSLPSADRLRLERDAARRLTAYREKELLDIKGPCSRPTCRLHYAHNGPCDVTKEQP